MRITDWYKSGDMETFSKFCNQNRRKLISVHLKSSGLVEGLLYDHRFKSIDSAGIFILLTDKVIHPAFFALSDITSLHYLASADLIRTKYAILVGGKNEERFRNIQQTQLMGQ